MIERLVSESNHSKAELRQQTQYELSWKRITRPDEIADIVEFVPLPDANFVSGTVIDVDGAQTVMLPDIYG